jgi:hypothetical protein
MRRNSVLRQFTQVKRAQQDGDHKVAVTHGGEWQPVLAKTAEARVPRWPDIAPMSATAAGSSAIRC